MDCGRGGCLHCEGKQTTGKHSQACTRSNVMYKGVCLTCAKNNEGGGEEGGGEEAEGEEGGGEDAEGEQNPIRTVVKKKSIYIGESSKSLNKRSE